MNITDENYLMIQTKSFSFTNKLAMFDLDFTLIKPKSKNIIPKNIDDWMFLYDNVIEILKEYQNKGYCIIIVSNQLKTEKKDLIKKTKNIFKNTDLEFTVFYATEKNKYRKPNCEIFDEFIIPNIEDKISKNSFFCGDACGREKDFSDCDYKFAENCKLKFKLPEEIFDNKSISKPEIKYPLLTNKNKFKYNPLSDLELIILVGLPASGKSSIAMKISKKYNYMIINQDTLKTKNKCHKMAEEYVNKKKSIIIDNTNPLKEDRKFYIDLVKKNKYSIVCIHVCTPVDLCLHNNWYRSNYSDKKFIPTIAYRVYNKKFEQIDKKEGYDKIICTECSCNSSDEKYYRYLY